MTETMEHPICACGDSFTADAMCVNCAIGTPTDMQVAREANFKLVKEVERLKGKTIRQRKELRRLNKFLGPYWAGFRNGASLEAECRLRGIMNATFGHAAVHAAEKAAIDKAHDEILNRS